MTDISNPVKQYTINTPADFEILGLSKRTIFKYKIMKNHDRNIRREDMGIFGANPVYDTMIEYFDTDYDFMPWYGFVGEYLHAFKIMSAVELSNNELSYEPLSIKLQDTRKLSIVNKFIETTLDLSKDSLFEAIQLGYAKHYNNECFINAFIDHYE
jgi:hypothetical protein